MIFQNRSEKRISFLVIATLLAVTLLTGFSVYWAARNLAELTDSRSLPLELVSRLRLIEHEVRQHLTSTLALRKKSDIREQLQSFMQTPTDATRKALVAPLQTALSEGFSALIVYDRQGVQLESVGRPAPAKFDLLLQLPQDTFLDWQDGYIVSTRIEIQKGERKIGTLVAQSRVSEIAGIAPAALSSGPASTLVLCAMGENKALRCLPEPKGEQTLAATTKPSPFMAAMALALQGKAGFTPAEAGPALAYMPLGSFGLGAVLSTEDTNGFQALLQQNRFLLPLLLLFVAVGGLMLRWQIFPTLRRAQTTVQQISDQNQKLLRNETRMRAVLEQVDEGIISISSDGMIRSLNPATERMFGYNSVEMLGQKVSILMAEEDSARHDQYLQRYLQSGKTSVLGSSREVSGRRKDGTLFPIELRLGEVKLEDEHLFIGSMRDISAIKAVEQRMLHLANHDSLTNLPNRNLLQDRARQALTQAHRQSHMVGVLCLDLDHFKTTNDLLGHPIGDRLLQTVAARILNCIRDEDTVARQGGDEFIVILPNIKRFEDVAIVAQKILVTLASAYSLDNTELHTSASIGVSVYPDDGKDVDILMRNADTAMYYAKATGRNNFQFFTPKMNQAITERMGIESKLRHALGRDEFVLNYQPIVNIATGQVGATEALLRWYPESGLIGPDRFIPVAEETGLIVPIGEWVIRAALRERRHWLEQGLTCQRMVVNLSARQFAQKNLVAIIGRILHEMELSPEHLGVEITESLIMDRPEDAVRTLRALSEMGVQISIDDFGTGYSSLSYLKRFPLDKIKIDRSFINDIATDSDDAAIVTAIIAMSHSLGARVVAEGVETEAQLNFLRAHGCDEFQGYFFSRPALGGELFDKLRMGMPVPDPDLSKALAENARPL